MSEQEIEGGVCDGECGGLYSDVRAESQDSHTRSDVLRLLRCVPSAGSGVVARQS